MKDPMKKSCQFVLAGVLATALLGASPPIWAQERYDDKEPLERWNVRIGGFYQAQHQSTVRIDSVDLGIGTLVDLEDHLDVDEETSMVRIDGFYRFNPRHSIEWTWFGIKREGIAELLDESLQIGDEVFEVGDVVATEWKTNVIKVGWAYSFINVRKYEFQIGAGLNVRDTSLAFENTLAAGGAVVEEEEEEDLQLPLPTLSFSARWSFSERTMLKGRFDWFRVKVGEFQGGLQEFTLTLEHDTFSHFGFGGGVSTFQFDVDYDDEEKWRGELETRYLGALLYVKIH